VTASPAASLPAQLPANESELRTSRCLPARPDATPETRTEVLAYSALVSEPILIAQGDGEIIGDSVDRRVEILSDHETLGATFGRLGSHHDGADLHVHRYHSDLFYVLEGELTVRLGIDDERVAVSAGALARVPPLVVHGFLNESYADVRYLNFHVPGLGFADYLRGLRDGRPVSFDQHPPPADGGRARTDAVVSGGELAVDRADLRLTLLADVEAIAVSEVWADATSPPAPAHVHRSHVESFYVLEGQLTFTIGERELRAEAGSWMQVPPGPPHALLLAVDRPVRYLDIHTPNCGFGAFLRG
jgi:quercetin dioxygenase-like cupin family protein